MKFSILIASFCENNYEQKISLCGQSPSRNNRKKTFLLRLETKKVE